MLSQVGMGKKINAFQLLLENAPSIPSSGKKQSSGRRRTTRGRRKLFLNANLPSFFCLAFEGEGERSRGKEVLPLKFFSTVG